MVVTQMGTKPPETLSTESLAASDIFYQTDEVLMEISSTTVMVGCIYLYKYI
jgi:hypothetical protein